MRPRANRVRRPQKYGSASPPECTEGLGLIGRIVRKRASWCDCCGREFAWHASLKVLNDRDAWIIRWKFEVETVIDGLVEGSHCNMQAVRARSPQLA